MQVLHVAQNTKLEKVKLLANKINRNNHLTAIERDGKVEYTGGFVFYDCEAIQQVFAAKPKSMTDYEFARILKQDPFIRLYLEE